MLIKLTFALICPMAIMIAIASGILIMMKQYHQRRMARMNVITGYQDSDLVYKDDLHATAAGDSTLRVSNTSIIGVTLIEPFLFRRKSLNTL